MVSQARSLPPRSVPRASAPPVSVPAGMLTHMLAAVIVACSVLALAWVRVATLHRGYELSRLQAEQQRLMDDARALEVEQATLRSPSRLTELARHTLQMVPPQAASVLSPDGKAVGP